jgi:phage terminase Nu1 subunit (DNA packaging protein)
MYLTRNAFAKRQGVQRQTVSRWVKAGWVVLASDGKRVDVERSEEKLKSRPEVYRGGRKHDAAQEHDPTLAEATRRKEMARAELSELRLARERGEWLSHDDVRQTWSQIMLAVRQMCLSWPGKITFEIPTLTPTDRATIERIVRDDLTDVSMGRGFLSTGKEGDENGGN